MRILGYMKARVNLTIEQELLTQAKNHAAKIGTSVSELVKSYFRKITETKQREIKLFEMIEKLEKPNLSDDFDHEKEYHEARKEKYGF